MGIEDSRDGQRADELAARVYDDLRAMASMYLRRERDDHTLQTTALVHEAYLRLAGARDVAYASREHFLAVAAGLFRRVLVDHVRRHDAAKRGGGTQRVRVDVSELVDRTAPVDLLILHDCLERLAALNSRQAQIVDLRFFGGLGEAEAATALEVSRATVTREWRFARAWLARELAHLDDASG